MIGIILNLSSAHILFRLYVYVSRLELLLIVLKNTFIGLSFEFPLILLDFVDTLYPIRFD
jgi:hypothetical protein